MAVFKYKAKNKENKIVSGTVEAETEDAAINILKDKELAIISLKEGSGKGGKKQIVLFSAIKPKDIVIFSRQFSVLISASVSLVQSLKLLVEQTTNPKFKIIIAEIADEVDGGEKLSSSLAKRPKVFSNFYVNVVKSGETSGKLDEVLNYLADELEKDYDMTSKIKGAMIYPAFVFVGMIGVGTVMMVFVVPKLTDVMRETGAELPMATKIIIALSDFLSGSWWLLIIILVGLAIGIKMLLKLPRTKKIVDTVLLHLPIFGKLFQKIYLVRFTRSLRTLLIGGVSISRALKITADVVDNYVFKNLIKETKKEVEDGNSISVVFSESKVMPGMVSQMMGIGEKTGRLDVILEKVTDFYTREINNVVANLMTLMEPIIMVIMGIGVGIMVAAIIMPMYNMASAV